MAKRKSKAVIKAANTSGELTQILDYRFEHGAWMIELDVQAEDADSWFRYLAKECTHRGWQEGPSLAQLDRSENSGSLSVHVPESDRVLAIVWERKRRKPLKVRARSVGSEVFDDDEARAFFRGVNDRVATGELERFHRRWLLQYNGLPWRGELWFGDSIRLSPPSLENDAVLLSDRLIVVDAVFEAIDGMEALAKETVILRELSVFLSCFIGETRPAQSGKDVWTWRMDESGGISCELKHLGYIELREVNGFPSPGEFPGIPMFEVRRPTHSRLDFDMTQTEIQVASDIRELWDSYRNLTPELRMQFLQAASMWQLALFLGREYPTASFAHMVAACEALKPAGQEFREHNIYDVIEGLLGNAIVAVMKEEWFQAQRVRSDYLHFGKVRGGEFEETFGFSTSMDMSFSQARSALARITESAIIEWLRLGANYEVPLRPKRKCT